MLVVPLVLVTMGEPLRTNVCLVTNTTGLLFEIMKSWNAAFGFSILFEPKIKTNPMLTLR